MTTGRVHVFAGFTLDLDRGLLRGPAGEVELRPKAWALLGYLATHPGRVVPKDELLDAVWPGLVVTDGSLAHCVGEIRRALGDPDGALVRTVPRRGYLLAAEVTSARPPAIAGLAPEASDPTGDAAGPPSVVVMPFASLGGDAHDDYFADGVVEEITSLLGRFRRLRVVARSSAFTYKGRAVDVREVGRALGARYVVEGSVRRAGPRLRLDVRLIDAHDGVQLWAERLAGVVDDVFDFQESVARSVIGAITPHVQAAEVERAGRKRPERLDAYDLYLRALPAVREMTREGNDRALEWVARALELDPDYAVMAALGGWAYTLRAAQDWSSDPEAEREAGLRLARRAIATGQDDPEALSMAGYALGYLGGLLRDGARAVDRAIALNPSDAFAYSNAGWLRAYQGDLDGGIAAFSECLRLSPGSPTTFRAQAGLCFALLLKGELERAIDAGRRSVESNPHFAAAHRGLAAALALAGRRDEARDVMARLRRLSPRVNVAGFAAQSLFRDSGLLDVLLDGLRAAGMPETLQEGG